MKVVGRYELLDPIGSGGMAVVYLARQTDLDRRVAVKELRLQSPGEPTLAERFLREARMAGSMSHPNIVTVHDYFEHEGTPYIAMEYLQRGSLRPLVGTLTLAQIAGVLEGLLAALDHAERLHVVHRDIKPENLLVTDGGQIKVADYGIAKARTLNTSAFLTAAGTAVGTPAYMAPEQAMAGELGAYTDLYAVGIVAYELVVGRVPFEDSDAPLAVILRHVNEQIPSAHSVRPEIDPGLSDWIDRLLVKDPAGRTQTADQAWDELEEIIVRLLGSRWRREARLVSASEQPARPLTPAPFASTGVETPAAEAAHVAEPITSEPVHGRPATAAVVERPPLHRRGWAIAAGAVVLMVAVVAVVLAATSGDGGSGDGPPPEVAGVRVLKTADLALTLPASWTERDVPDIPGLHGEKAVAATPGAGSYVAAELVAGTADATLLPQALVKAVKRRPKPETVTLAGVRAYRYDALAPRGIRERLRVYAVLTEAGVAVVVCGMRPSAAATAAGNCDRVARTVKLISAKALRVGPTTAYAAILKRTFTSLAALVTTSNARLDVARTVAGQAAMLGRIADAYAAAAASLRRSADAARRHPDEPPGPLDPVDAGLNAALATVFEQVAVAYRRYARAWVRGSGAAKTRAKQAAVRARPKLDAGAGSLHRAGYSAEPRATPRAEVKAPRASTPPLPPVSPRPAPPAGSPRIVRPPPPPVLPPPPPPPPPAGSGEESGTGG